MVSYSALLLQERSFGQGWAAASAALFCRAGEQLPDFGRDAKQAAGEEGAALPPPRAPLRFAGAPARDRSLSAAPPRLASPPPRRAGPAFLRRRRPPPPAPLPASSARSASPPPCCRCRRCSSLSGGGSSTSAPAKAGEERADAPRPPPLPVRLPCPPASLAAPQPRAPARPAEMAEKPGRRRRRHLRLLLLAVAFAALTGRGYADDFDLEDALDGGPPTKRPTHKPPKKSSGGTGELDLLDYFDTPPERTTKPAKATTGPFPRKPDDGRWNVLHTTTTTKQPKTTKPPPKKTPANDPDGFDLADALDDRNGGQGGGPPNVSPGRGSKGRGGKGGEPGISDDDLVDILGGGEYQPEKKKGGSGGSGGGDSNYDDGTLVETGTIAGIVSGLAMALIGAVSSYISYQQKKFCFSIQQGLNAEYVKGENMEAVVTEEPQVKYSVLEPQSAEPPPPQENAKV
ncbi:CD99 antigen-like protein 2 [Elgaria multicarinata webbii]|uniref:CD99 antigen-like protein 2 n=1 Tax=Elgaria multicarinata webbii TaxID=159646 RepID=UPI002FCD4D78